MMRYARYTWQHRQSFGPTFGYHVTFAALSLHLLSTCCSRLAALVDEAVFPQTCCEYVWGLTLLRSFWSSRYPYRFLQMHSRCPRSCLGSPLVSVPKLAASMFGLLCRFWARQLGSCDNVPVEMFLWKCRPMFRTQVGPALLETLL